MIRLTALAHGAALALFAALAHTGLTALLIPAAALAGACFPPVATVSRAAWRAVEGEDARRALFALDGVTTELTLIAGPLLATALSTTAGAPATVALVGALVVAAALAAARSPLLPRGDDDDVERAPARRVGEQADTAPRARRAAPAALAPSLARGVPPAPAGASPHRAAGPRARGAPFPRGLVTLLAATVAMAAALGAITVGSVAFAEDASLPSGLPLTVMAVGGVAGALAWGARALPLSHRAQLVGGLVLYAAVVLAATTTRTPPPRSRCWSRPAP